MPASVAMTCLLIGLMEAGEGPRQSSEEDFGDLGETVSPWFYCHGGVKPMLVQPPAVYQPWWTPHLPETEVNAPILQMREVKLRRSELAQGQTGSLVAKPGLEPSSVDSHV